MGKTFEEIVSKRYEEFVNRKTASYKRTYNVDITITPISEYKDRYNNVVKVGDTVDFCAAAPGGLRRGRIAFIPQLYIPEHYEKRYKWTEHKYECVDELIPEKTIVYEVYIYTNGKRWTDKSQDVIIKVPEK